MMAADVMIAERRPSGTKDPPAYRAFVKGGIGVRPALLVVEAGR